MQQERRIQVYVTIVSAAIIVSIVLLGVLLGFRAAPALWHENMVDDPALVDSITTALGTPGLELIVSATSIMAGFLLGVLFELTGGADFRYDIRGTERGRLFWACSTGVALIATAWIVSLSAATLLVPEGLGVIPFLVFEGGVLAGIARVLWTLFRRTGNAHQFRTGALKRLLVAGLLGGLAIPVIVLGALAAYPGIRLHQFALFVYLPEMGDMITPLVAILFFLTGFLLSAGVARRFW